MKKDGLYIQNNINLFIYLVNNHTYIYEKINIKKEKGKKMDIMNILLYF